MHIQTILDYLQVQAASPNLALLDRLMAAYIRRVPWESASRIAAKQGGLFPRWPEIFWQQAQRMGTGGTCFESNYAFYTLLRGLGYEGYLTINNMGSAVGCHTAIVILLDGHKWLVDVGIPLHAPLPIDPHQITTRESPLQGYTVRPVGAQVYDILRDPHPNPLVFTLIDQPVSELAYRAATAADYQPGGYFLDQVIFSKVIDEQVWRFASSSQPYRLETFISGTREDRALPGDDPVPDIAAKFGVDVSVIRAALAAV